MPLAVGNLPPEKMTKRANNLLSIEQKFSFKHNF